MSKSETFFTGISIGISIGLLIGMIMTLSNWEHHDDIIEQGAAYYHPKTGEFTWKREL